MVRNCYEKRKNWKECWIVDPLDGTKEFIKRNGEFTVNIALIKNNKPIIGVIYVPVSKCLYFASYQGSFKELEGEQLQLPIMRNNKIYKVVGSRSHVSSETEKYYADLMKEKNEIEFVSMGSSIKICLVAEGVADVYPRFAPTMEWDTAAGHAVLSGAGGKVVRFDDLTPLTYGKDTYANPFFIAYAPDVELKDAKCQF